MSANCVHLLQSYTLTIVKFIVKRKLCLYHYCLYIYIYIYIYTHTPIYIYIYIYIKENEYATQLDLLFRGDKI